eukprot:Platyproteum_vivax@DN2963_c0_g1_i1.p1
MWSKSDRSSALSAATAGSPSKFMDPGKNCMKNVIYGAAPEAPPPPPFSDQPPIADPDTQQLAQNLSDSKLSDDVATDAKLRSQLSGGRLHIARPVSDKPSNVKWTEEADISFDDARAIREAAAARNRGSGSIF